MTFHRQTSSRSYSYSLYDVCTHAKKLPPSLLQMEDQQEFLAGPNALLAISTSISVTLRRTIAIAIAVCSAAR